MLESRFCGLPFSRLQYQYRIFTNGLSGIIRMGQNPDDGSIAYFADHGGSTGRSRSKYSLASPVKAQAAEATSLRCCGHVFPIVGMDGNEVRNNEAPQQLGALSRRLQRASYCI
jgi:hypothetical protein